MVFVRIGLIGKKGNKVKALVSLVSKGVVEFSYFRPGALSVCVAGDFNDWCAVGLAMEKDELGWWRRTLELEPGEYNFKYVVDGCLWEADFASFGVKAEKNGEWVSVVYVDESAEMDVKADVEIGLSVA